MALTATEEALLRDMLEKQAQLIALANNETTITAKLSSTKATIDDLTAATTVADADLMIVRQGGVDKKLPVSVVKSDLLASPALTGVPTAPTAAQFDNDTSLATTAFVQRALGNHQRAIPITSVGNFLASDAGGAFYIGAAGTYNLPLISSVPEGSKFTFLATVNSVVISRSGSDSLLVGSAAANTLTLNNGDTATFIKVGTFWTLMTGTASGRGSTGDFGKSLATSGYQKLPSGLIIQWGLANSGSVTFPITFPTACQSITATTSSTAPDGNTRDVWTTTVPTTTGATFSRTSNVDGFRWIAIGY